MNDFGINALRDADEMIRNCMNPYALEYAQTLGIAELTANRPELEFIRSDLEEIQTIQTSLEAIKSSVFDELRNHDQIFSGISGSHFDIGAEIIFGLDGIKEKETSLRELAPSFKGSSIDLAMTAFGNDLTYTAAVNDFRIDELRDADEMIRKCMNPYAFECIQTCGIAGTIADRPELDFIRSDLEESQPIQTSLEALKTSVCEELRNHDQIFSGISGSFLDAGAKFTSCFDGIKEIAKLESIPCVSSTKSELSAFENGLIPELALIKPYKFEPPNLPNLLIKPISREVRLAPETIDLLAEKIAEKGGRIEIIATHRSVVIAGNATNNSIETCDKSSNKEH